MEDVILVLFFFLSLISVAFSVRWHQNVYNEAGTKRARGFTEEEQRTAKDTISKKGKQAVRYSSCEKLASNALCVGVPVALSDKKKLFQRNRVSAASFTGLINSLKTTEEAIKTGSRSLGGLLNRVATVGMEAPLAAGRIMSRCRKVVYYRRPFAHLFVGHPSSPCGAMILAWLTTSQKCKICGRLRNKLSAFIVQKELTGGRQMTIRFRFRPRRQSSCKVILVLDRDKKDCIPPVFQFFIFAETLRDSLYPKSRWRMCSADGFHV